MWLQPLWCQALLPLQEFSALHSVPAPCEDLAWRRSWKEPQGRLPSLPLGSSFQAEGLALHPHQPLVSHLLNPDPRPLTWLSGLTWDLPRHHRLAGQLLNWGWSQLLSLGLITTLTVLTTLGPLSRWHLPLACLPACHHQHPTHLPSWGCQLWLLPHAVLPSKLFLLNSSCS